MRRYPRSEGGMQCERERQRKRRSMRREKVTDESRTRPESMKAMRWENRVCDENGE